MLIKNPKTKKTSLSPFDLLGNNETALAKAFSYLLATDKNCYFEFINFLGAQQSNTEARFLEVEIQTERHRKEGRTDIELTDNKNYQIIVECKVNSGKVIAQRTQYFSSFDRTIKTKILCFITQERDTNKQYQDNILIKNTSWLEIIELFSNKKYSSNENVLTFLKICYQKL